MLVVAYKGAQLWWNELGVDEPVSGHDRYFDEDAICMVIGEQGLMYHVVTAMGEGHIGVRSCRLLTT